MQGSERTVVFGHVEEDTVGQTLTEQVQDNFSTKAISDGVPKFDTVSDYTTFTAEYTLKDKDIVVHFFLPKDFRRSGQAAHVYWTTTFAVALDSVAQEVFQATQPRLQAKYTEELNSWWLRARGYDHLIDTRKFMEKFFERLDEELERALALSIGGRNG